MVLMMNRKTPFHLGIEYIRLFPFYTLPSVHTHTHDTAINHIST